MRSDYNDSLTLEVSIDTVEVFRKGDVEQQQLYRSPEKRTISLSAAEAYHQAKTLDELRSFNTEQDVKKLPSWLPSLNTSSHELEAREDNRSTTKRGQDFDMRENSSCESRFSSKDGSITERSSGSDLREDSSREGRFSSLKSWSTSSNILRMPTERTDNRSCKDVPDLGPWIKGPPPKADIHNTGCSGFMCFFPAVKEYLIPTAMTQCTTITSMDSSADNDETHDNKHHEI